MKVLSKFPIVHDRIVTIFVGHPLNLGQGTKTPIKEKNIACNFAILGGQQTSPEAEPKICILIFICLEVLKHWIFLLLFFC